MAGSWADLTYRVGQSQDVEVQPIGLVSEFTADASDGSIPDETVPDETGILVGIDVEFDATTPPDALVVVFKTIGGITLVTGASLTASGRIEVDPALPFVGGYILSCSTNTTNSAKAKVIPLVVTGERA